MSYIRVFKTLYLPLAYLKPYGVVMSKFKKGSLNDFAVIAGNKNVRN